MHPSDRDLLIEQSAASMLAWALRKTGSRHDAEELAQEALLQLIIAAERTEHIREPERFMWKIAHYTWCNRLRLLGKERQNIGLHPRIPDANDFTEEHARRANHEAMLEQMRRRVINLSRVQREAMILHYLDGHPVAEVARRLGIAESAVTWHLHDARKRVKKELEDMPTINPSSPDYVYRPGKLRLGGSGIMGEHADTRVINESLIKQNLCLLCYREARTLDELAGATGIPKPYLEFDLEWLVRREFLSLEGRRYRTIFPIVGRRHHQDIGTLFAATRGVLIDRVLDGLWGSVGTIRSIGFYGSDFPAERLMWSMIMMFLSYASRQSPLLTQLKERDEREVRPDGGRYYIMAGDHSEGQALDPDGYVKPPHWHDFYGICSDSCATGGSYDTYYWLGVYTFADRRHHPAVIDRSNPARQAMLHDLYCAAVHPDFNADALNPAERIALAEAVADQMITKHRDAYRPNFVIMKPEQLKRLQDEVFAPLLSLIVPQLEALSERIMSMHRKNMPKANLGYTAYYTYVDLWNFGIYALMFAAQDGRLRLPETPEEGAALTLVLVE